jgi:hypothetical protein
VADYNAGTIKATVDANTRPYAAAMARAAATTTAATRKMERDADRASRSVAGLSGNAQVLSRRLFDVSAAVSGLALPAIASLIRPAAAGIDALAGGAVILTKSITDMSGAIAAVPIGLSAMVQGMGAAKFATMGLGDAVRAYASGDNEEIREALKNTSAEAGEFAKALVAMQPEIEKIRDAAAEGLFPGLTRGLEIAAQNLPQLKASMAGTAEVLGDLAEQAGRLLGSESFGERFATITRRNAELLGTAGDTGLDFADALATIMVEARPITQYLNEQIGALGDWARNATEAAAASGDLRDFFRDSVDAVDDWGTAIGNTGGLLRDLFAAAEGPADQFRTWLVDTTAGWEKWSESARGTREIEAFFDRITPTLQAAGALFGDLVKAIWDLGNTDAAQQGFVAFAEALRTQLLPALTALASDVGPEMAVNLVDLATAIAKVLNMGSFNPILEMVGAFSELAIAITNLVGAIPGASTALGILSAYFVATRVINVARFGVALTGVGQSIQKMRGFLGPTSAALGAFMTSMRSSTTAATAASTQMSALMQTQKAMPGITLGAVGPTQKVTAANRLMGSASMAAAGAAGLLAGAIPAVAAVIGVALVNSIMDANAAAEEFTNQWEGLKSEMSTGEFENAAKMLDEMSGKIEKNSATVAEYGGKDLMAQLLGDPRAYKQLWDSTMASIENDGLKATLTFWDSSDSGGMREAYAEMLAEREKFQSTWLQLNSDFEKAMGEQGTDKWFEAQAIRMGKFEDLALEAGVNVQRLAELTGSEYAAAMERASQKVAVYYTTQIAADEATKTFYNSMEILNDKFATSAEKADAAYNALMALQDGLAGGEREAIAFAATLDEYRQGLTRANFQLNKSGTALKRNTDATREGASAMLRMRDEALRLTSAKFAEIEATKGTKAAVADLNERYKSQYRRVLDVMTAITGNRKEAKKMVDAYMRVPKEVKTFFQNPDIQKRIEEGESIADILKDLDGKKVSSKVEVPGAEEARGTIGRLREQVNDFVSKQYRANVVVSGAVDPSSDQYLFRKANGSTVPLGSISAYAEGGPVRGMGGSRDDNIPAWLSNGEFVVRAAAVRKYGTAFFQRLNQAVGMANGGQVGTVAAGEAMTAAEQRAVWQKIYDRLFKQIDDKSTSKDDAASEAKARKQANREMERVLKQATRNLERSMKQVVKSMEQAAKAAVKQAQQAYDQRVASVRQGIQGFGSVTQTGGTEYLSGAGLVEEMQARADAAKAFRASYNDLEGLGLNKKSLKEILAAGPQEGQAIAEALLEGGKAAVKKRIDEINRLEQQITKTGKALGTDAAINEGLRADIRDARDNLRAVQTTEVTVSEGAVKVQIDLSGVDKDDAQKIEQVVDRSVNRALKEFARELRRN